MIIPSVLASSVKRVRVAVIQIWNVKALLFVVLTTAQVDMDGTHMGIWTAVQVRKVEKF